MGVHVVGIGDVDPGDPAALRICQRFLKEWQTNERAVNLFRERAGDPAVGIGFALSATAIDAAAGEDVLDLIYPLGKLLGNGEYNAAAVHLANLHREINVAGRIENRAAKPIAGTPEAMRWAARMKCREAVRAFCDDLAALFGAWRAGMKARVGA